MEKLKKYLSPRKITLFLSTLIVVLSISFINEPAESQTQGIVTSMAIDIVDDQVKLACSVLAPTSGLQAKSNLYCAESSTLAQAIEAIGLQLGKDLGFAQCDVVALGENIENENLMYVLDYFNRTKKVGRNVLLLSYEGDAGDFIQAVIYLQEEKSLSLSEILHYNKEYLLAVDINMENFYLGYYGDSGVSLLPKLKLTDQETKLGVSVEIESKKENAGLINGASGESSDARGSSSQSKTKKYLTNDGSTTVFKNGKKLYDFSPEEIRKLNLYIKKSKYGAFTLEHISDDYYKDATVVLALEDKSVKTKYKFVDGKPVVKVDIQLYVKVDEIIEPVKNERILRREEELLTEKVVNELKALVKREVNEIFEKQKEINADCLNIYSNFNKFQYKEWKKYVERVGQDNFMSEVSVDCGVKVSQHS